MPGTSAPSPATAVTFAIEVPDFHSLAARFKAAGIPPITVAEARALGRRRVTAPTDAPVRAIEVAVHIALEDALPARRFLVKYLAGGISEVFVRDVRGIVLVGEFGPVVPAQRTERAA